MRRRCILLPFLLSAALTASGCADAPVNPAAADDAAPAAEQAQAPDAATPATRQAPTPPRARSARSAAASAGAAAVIASVTDGDTVRLRDGRRVRLVQVDTPEVRGRAECGGREASRALSAQLPPGTRVRLVIEPSADAVDDYGRLLRYVYRGSTNLNVWLVARGHAAPYFYDGQRGRFAAQLERSARRARARGIGFWGHCPNAVLDAYRGVATGALRPSAASDAAAGAEAVSTAGAARASLPAEPPYPPDLDCADLPGPVRVSRADPHRLDRDGDGVGCD